VVLESNSEWPILLHSYPLFLRRYIYSILWYDFTILRQNQIAFSGVHSFYVISRHLFVCMLGLSTLVHRRRHVVVQGRRRLRRWRSKPTGSLRTLRRRHSYTDVLARYPPNLDKRHPGPRVTEEPRVCKVFTKYAQPASILLLA